MFGIVILGLVGPAVAEALECDFVESVFSLTLIDKTGPPALADPIASVEQLTITRNAQSDLELLCFEIASEQHCVDTASEVADE